MSAGLAVEVHRQEHPGAFGDDPARREPGSRLNRPRLDIGEDGRCAALENRVQRRDEGERRS